MIKLMSSVTLPNRARDRLVDVGLSRRVSAIRHEQKWGWVIRDIRVVVLLIITLLWQTSAVAVPVYCSMGDEANERAAIPHDAAEHNNHEAMLNLDDQQHNEMDCCVTGKSGTGCVTSGCVVPVQLLIPMVALPMAPDTRSSGIVFLSVVFPPAPIFPFLRPPIA
ncbi:MAG: hypothetical protein COB19_00405 [Porticoccus sp.]|nr:MAG: hypothetical protein COB19_00405 [Porticoccus sp.]